MPWKETCPMNERLQMATLYQTGRYTVSELAREFHVSRKTATKWLRRFTQEGVEGLTEHSRAPEVHPNATPATVVDALLRAKKRHPTWGPAKLLPGPGDSETVAERWPAVSTRGSILAKHGLTGARRRRRRTPPWTQPFRGYSEPNSVWCADFKGWFRTGDGARCDPLTVTDGYSRMLLVCQAVSRPDQPHVRPVFERAFREYGLPLAVRRDNGPPFASTAAGGLSLLSVWWIKLGIWPERIEPGHPEQNGRHERMHRTLKQETARPPAASPRAQQDRFEVFRREYNTERPHQALGQVPPATLYLSSPRAYPTRIEDFSYPYSEVRRVRTAGEIRWRGELIYISEALVGELIGVEEDQDGWLVTFGPIPLGFLRPGHQGLDRLLTKRKTVKKD